MIKCMVDVETLSQQPNAAVISIGMAFFDDTQVIAAESWAIAPADWHGDLQPETIQWWINQSEIAREFSFNGKSCAKAVAIALHDLIDKHSPDEFWANDPDFDLIILKAWWSRCAMVMKFPIPFWSHRSYRTLVSLTKELTGIDPKKEWAGSFIAHNPTEDAVAQSRVVIQCRKILKTMHDARDHDEQ